MDRKFTGSHLGYPEFHLPSALIGSVLNFDRIKSLRWWQTLLTLSFANSFVIRFVITWPWDWHRPFTSHNIKFFSIILLQNHLCHVISVCCRIWPNTHVSFNAVNCKFVVIIVKFHGFFIRTHINPVTTHGNSHDCSHVFGFSVADLL